MGKKRYDVSVFPVTIIPFFTSIFQRISAVYLFVKLRHFSTVSNNVNDRENWHSVEDIDKLRFFVYNVNEFTYIKEKGGPMDYYLDLATYSARMRRLDPTDQKCLKKNVAETAVEQREMIIQYLIKCPRRHFKEVAKFTDDQWDDWAAMFIPKRYEHKQERTQEEQRPDKYGKKSRRH